MAVSGISAAAVVATASHAATNEKPAKSLFEALQSVFQRVVPHRAPDGFSFSIAGACQLPLPGLVVTTVAGSETGSAAAAAGTAVTGEVLLPLQLSQARALLPQFERAPYGVGCYHLNPNRFAFTNPQWQAAVDELVASRVIVGLGLPPTVKALRARLSHVALFLADATHPPRRATPSFADTASGVFATLTVQFPAEHSGGEWIVTHGRLTHTIDFARESKFEFAFSARYCDVACELKPLKSGARLCAEYDLICDTAMPADATGVLRARPLEFEEEIDRALCCDVLQRWCIGGDEIPPRKMAYLLANSYTTDSLSFDGLKGSDRRIANTILAFNASIRDWPNRVRAWLQAPTDAGASSGAGLPYDLAAIVMSYDPLWPCAGFDLRLVFYERTVTRYFDSKPETKTVIQPKPPHPSTRNLPAALALARYAEFEDNVTHIRRSELFTLRESGVDAWQRIRRVRGDHESDGITKEFEYAALVLYPIDRSLVWLDADLSSAVEYVKSTCLFDSTAVRSSPVSSAAAGTNAGGTAAAATLSAASYRLLDELFARRPLDTDVWLTLMDGLFTPLARHASYGAPFAVQLMERFMVHARGAAPTNGAFVNASTAFWLLEFAKEHDCFRRVMIESCKLALETPRFLSSQPLPTLDFILAVNGLDVRFAANPAVPPTLWSYTQKRYRHRFADSPVWPAAREDMREWLDATRIGELGMCRAVLACRRIPESAHRSPQFWWRLFLFALCVTRTMARVQQHVSSDGVFRGSTADQPFAGLMAALTRVASEPASAWVLVAGVLPFLEQLQSWRPEHTPPPAPPSASSSAAAAASTATAAAAATGLAAGAFGASMRPVHVSAADAARVWALPFRALFQTAIGSLNAARDALPTATLRTDWSAPAAVLPVARCADRCEDCQLFSQFFAHPTETVLAFKSLVWRREHVLPRLPSGYYTHKAGPGPKPSDAKGGWVLTVTKCRTPHEIEIARQSNALAEAVKRVQALNVNPIFQSPAANESAAPIATARTKRKANVDLQPPARRATTAAAAGAAAVISLVSDDDSSDE